MTLQPIKNGKIVVAIGGRAIINVAVISTVSTVSTVLFLLLAFVAPRAIVGATAAVRAGSNTSEEISQKRATAMCINPSTHVRFKEADVYFVGVSKSGTTSLANWMAHHPQLRWTSMSTLKLSPNQEQEIGLQKGNPFISAMHLLPDGTYGRMTPGANGTEHVVKYAPHLLTVTELPYRLLNAYGDASHNGDMKYIVILREPAMRSISSWRYRFSIKFLQEGFHDEAMKLRREWRELADAVQADREGVANLLQCRAKEGPLPSDVISRCVLDIGRCPPDRYIGNNGNLHFAHVGKSMYAMELERWFFLLGQQNFKIVFFEEMLADPLGTLDSVFDFLGMELMDRDGSKGLPAREDWERVVAAKLNETPQKLNINDQVTPEIIQSLRDFYAPHNTELEELLGRRVPESWSTTYR